jgi:hypothetical protein
MIHPGKDDTPIYSDYGVYIMTGSMNHTRGKNQLYPNLVIERTMTQSWRNDRERLNIRWVILRQQIE